MNNAPTMYRVNMATNGEGEDNVVPPSIIICESNLEISTLDNPKMEAHPNVVCFNANNGPNLLKTLP